MEIRNYDKEIISLDKLHFRFYFEFFINHNPVHISKDKLDFLLFSVYDIAKLLIFQKFSTSKIIFQILKSPPLYSDMFSLQLLIELFYFQRRMLRLSV